MMERIASNLPTVAVAIGRALPMLLRDAIGIAGVALIAYGAWRAWPPAGFLVGGAMLLAIALLAARQGKQQQ